MSWSLLVRNGRVVDGSGTPAGAADVAVDRDRIVAVGPGLAGEAARVLDATGLVVAPGFIDMHCHSDFAYLACPSAESKLRQGVTTEVVGMCGYSPAPVRPERRAQLERLSAAVGFRLQPDWTSFGEYLERVRRARPSVNVAPFVGHHPLRLATVGMDDRPATPAELGAMEGLLGEALDAGAFGLSSGIATPPGAYASGEELVALARAMAGRSGAYFSHVRDEATGLEPAVAEAIRVGAEGGVSVEIAHVKAAGRENWPKLERVLAAVDAAQARGVDAHADVYPYPAASMGLFSLLPAWVHEGGLPRLVERLGDPGVRQKIVAECALPGDRWQSVIGSAGWDEVLIAGCSRPELEGLTLAELAQRRGRPGAQTMMDLLQEEAGAVPMVIFSQSEANVGQALRHPRVMVGSDSTGLWAGPGPHPGKPHPRSYGAFPRVLAVYVREQGVLSLESAVHKMTGMPARKLRLRDRGLVRAGYAADLALFDPAAVRDEATYADPHRYASGIPYVVVNGQIVVDAGRLAPHPAGQVLTRP
jgi:N-acyl-D-amino-acid deacylase